MGLAKKNYWPFIAFLERYKVNLSVRNSIYSKAIDNPASARALKRNIQELHKNRVWPKAKVTLKIKEKNKNKPCPTCNAWRAYFAWRSYCLQSLWSNTIFILIVAAQNNTALILQCPFRVEAVLILGRLLHKHGPAAVKPNKNIQLSLILLNRIRRASRFD